MCLLANTVNAQFRGLGDGEGFIGGIAVISDWSPYEGAESPSITPVPYLSYDWENAHLGVDGFNYNFFDNGAIELTLLADPRWSFGDPEDSPLFVDIERDTALEAGLQATIDWGALYVGTTVLADISEVHNGFEFSAEFGFNGDIGALDLSFSAGIAYRDRNLSAHLYGVRPEEARQDLAAYSPAAAWYPYLESVAFYPLGDSLGILCFARYEYPGDEAMNSPLISKRRDANIGFGLLKRF